MKYQVNGVVDSSFSKQKTSKAGRPFTIHYIIVDGVTISTGFKQEHTDGEHINIAVEEKYKEWQKVPNRSGDGLPSIDGASMAPQSTPTPIRGTFKGNKGSFPVEPTDGQMSIIRQSSMNRAVEIMDQLVGQGILKIKTRDEYMHELLEIALMVTDFGSGQDIMQLKKAQAANKAVNQ
jgi:hypothetical protein